MELKPREYQIEGRDLTVAMKRCINGDCMGLGKTIQTILAIEKARAEGLFNAPVLIVCPASLKYNWQEEIEKWSNKKAYILADDTKTFYPQFFANNMFHYFITNYESLPKYFTSYIPSFDNYKVKDIVFKPEINFFKWIVFDESQRLNNPETRQTKLSYALSVNKEYVTMLTGTPIVNKVNDLATILYILGYIDKFGGYTHFINKYHDATPDELRQLGEKLRDVCYFRREKDILGLPPKTRKILFVDLDTESQKEYDKAQNDLRGYLLEYKQKTENEVRKSLRAKVMVQLQLFREIAAKGKLKAAKEFIQTTIENGEKIVVFGVHRSITEAIRDEFNCLFIAGGISAQKRNEAVKSFQTNPDEKIISCSIRAAGVGLTLTEAVFTLFIEQWFNPALNDQAEDRIYRIGTTKPVFAIYLVAKNTIDEKIWKKSEKRREIANNVTLSEENVVWEIFDKIYDSEGKTILSDKEFDMFADVFEKMLTN